MCCKLLNHLIPVTKGAKKLHTLVSELRFHEGIPTTIFKLRPFSRLNTFSMSAVEIQHKNVNMNIAMLVDSTVVSMPGRVTWF